MRRTKNPLTNAILLTFFSVAASVFTLFYLKGTILALCFIFVSIFCVFQLMENEIIEYKCEKEFKHKIFLQEGTYIDLTDEEYNRIKDKLNDEAVAIIERIEKKTATFT